MWKLCEKMQTKWNKYCKWKICTQWKMYTLWVLCYCVSRILYKSNLNGELSREVAQEKWVDGDENSYILFTSGSTGKPKGVEISTYNLDSFIN